MRKQIVYILCGLPFSGKTRLAKKLTEKFNFSHLNVDDLVKARDKNGAVSEEEWKRVFTESYKKLEVLLKNGKSVMFDATNYTKSVRDQLREVALRNKVGVKVIFLDIPKETAKERLKENRILNKRKDVLSSDFKEVVDNFEKPTEEENVIVYKQEPLESWIEQNIV